MRRTLPLLVLALLCGCKPPASDDYVERSRIASRGQGPSDPIDTPDTTGAFWAQATRPGRIIYGKPGQPPLFALECVDQDGTPRIAYTRIARADPHAKAILALIGNGHVERFRIDALETGGNWLWQGVAAAQDPALDVLTGQREVEATVAGAGSLILNPSALPGALVETCRSRAAAEPETASAPAPAPSPVPSPPAGPA